MSAESHAGTVFAEALRNHQQGEHRRAAVLYRKVLARIPAHPEALHMLGLIEAQAGKLAVAADLLGRSARIRPDNPEVWNNYANALLGLRRPAEALEAYDRAIGLRADYADAHLNRGSALRTLGRSEDALASYDQALLLEGESAEAHCNRGNALYDLHRMDEAIESCNRALAVSPGHVEALCNRGAVRVAMRQRGEALRDFEEALKSNPLHPSTLNNLGDLLSVMGRYGDAARAFDRLQDAVPGYDYAAGYAQFARLRCCDWSDYDQRTRQLIESVRKGQCASVPFALLALSDSSSDQHRCAQQEIARRFPAIPNPVWKGERYAHKRIRVAYLSADFHEHATAHLAAGLFEMHDRGRFEVTAVSFGPDRRDAMRQRLSRAFDQFLDVADVPDVEVARQLREREIDIAVDLAGFVQESGPGIFAHRFAPVQVNYLGYPGTLGAEFIDYLIADRIVIPPEDARNFSERIVYLPGSYQINDSKRVVAPQSLTRTQAGLPASGFVFCCFNNNFKITPAMFDIWMRLLRDVQGSVLWLLEDNPEAARNLRREAARRGIAGERLVFAGRMAPPQHLARHALADLFLDTLPYNAHTTASDALWAGLPVLTCRGSTFPGRVATSLLHAIGLPEMSVAGMQAYEAKALQLAGDPAELAQLRGRLEGNRRTHPLFDTLGTTRQLESAYAAMLRRAEQSEQPAAFAIQPDLQEHAP